MSRPHEGKTELSMYPKNYVYALYERKNYDKQDLEASSVTEKRIEV